jgi:plasmid stabilization system protein ParE
MRSYRLTSLARTDLKDIWNTVGHRSADRGDRFLNELFARFQEIADEPMGPASEDIIYDSTCRILAAYQYFIFYRHHENRIEIVRILEGADHLRFW